MSNREIVKYLKVYPLLGIISTNKSDNFKDNVASWENTYHLMKCGK